MKNLINETIKQKIKDGETPGIFFRNRFDDSGHIQFDRRNDWAIFFNSKCVHVSKTLISAVKKLEKLNVTENDLILDN